MKHSYDKVKALLEEDPRTRERKNKTRTVAYILRKKHVELADIPNRKLAEILAESNTLDRMWRKVTEDHERLRGEDYNEKAEAEKPYKAFLAP
jgi:hypothetical protein